MRAPARRFNPASAGTLLGASSSRPPGPAQPSGYLLRVMSKAQQFQAALSTKTYGLRVVHSDIHAERRRRRWLSTQACSDGNSTMELTGALLAYYHWSGFRAGHQRRARHSPRSAPCRGTAAECVGCTIRVDDLDNLLRQAGVWGEYLSRRSGSRRDGWLASAKDTEGPFFRHDAKMAREKVSRLSPAERPERLYLTVRQHRGLNRLYSTMANYAPKDFAAQNNLAATSLLLRLNLPRAHQLAKEVISEHPEEAIFASTYAFSLHLQGRTKEGLAALEKFKPSALEYPSVAVYYGLLLSESGETNKAGKYLAIAQKAELLPEEKALVAEALKRTGRPG